MAGGTASTEPGDIGEVAGADPVGKKDKPKPRGGRSPSMYYSPSANRKQKGGTEPKETKPSRHATAAKSAAKAAAEKPKKTKKQVDPIDPPAPKVQSQKPPKVESQSPPVDPVAVQAALHRANTIEAAPEKPAAQDDANDASSEASGEPESDGSEESQKDGGLDPDTQPDATGGPTLEQVRKKKEAHARFMRFSRSLKSYLVANRLTKMMLNTVLVLVVSTRYTCYSRLFVLTLAVLSSQFSCCFYSGE